MHTTDTNSFAIQHQPVGHRNGDEVRLCEVMVKSLTLILLTW